MALKKPTEATISGQAEKVFSQVNAQKKDDTKEKLKTISFQIKPSDYEKLKEIFDDLGLSTGSGLRFALNEFIRKHQK